jgi:hypothetical protein
MRGSIGVERAGRESVQAAVEVTAVMALPTGRGNVAYLFGTRPAPAKSRALF